MGKIRPGNKQNCELNGEWGAHVKAWEKHLTSKIRRRRDRIAIEESKDSDSYFLDDDCPTYWVYSPRNLEDIPTVPFTPRSKRILRRASKLGMTVREYKRFLWEKNERRHWTAWRSLKLLNTK